MTTTPSGSPARRHVRRRPLRKRGLFSGSARGGNMAEIESPLAVDNATLNDTEAIAANATGRFVATPEGSAVAYGSLVLMALLPIFFGALRSVSCAKSKNSSDMPETITSRDAARFPIIASCTLFGLYLFFKIFSEEYINLLLSMYFFILGILALSHTLRTLKEKNRVFNEEWELQYYVVVTKDKMMCLLYDTIIATVKKYNEEIRKYLKRCQDKGLTSLEATGRRELSVEHFSELAKVTNEQDTSKSLWKCDVKEYTAVLDSLIEEYNERFADFEKYDLTLKLTFQPHQVDVSKAPDD
ncbi:uncharacterized protein LOC125485497 [Rhincodon typus]|uniref:uncharacterized protein LOC125485497 n=1 Tax=Rhincodon typus TaxID=259920 RepID=UPI00202DE97F|nr:uncharacterized protein LOC125485497 [Rhincodon typus]